MSTLYEILEVEENATTKEIKKAYRSLSKIHHPDKGGDEEEFKKISEAYNILSDEKLREAYDNGASLEEVKQESDGLMRRIFSIFEEALNSAGFVPEYSDLFVRMRELCNEKELRMEKDIEEYENQINNVKDIQKRMKNAQIFVNYLDNEIAELKRRIENTGEEKEYLYRILDFISNCEYEVNEEEDYEHRIPSGLEYMFRNPEEEV